MNLDNQKELAKSGFNKINTLQSSVTDKVKSARDSALVRFPLLFLLLSSFGLVATFYGFEKVIDQIPFFIRNPEMILLTGILVLVGTGALYKKLN